MVFLLSYCQNCYNITIQFKAVNVCCQLNHDYAPLSPIINTEYHIDEPDNSLSALSLDTWRDLHYFHYLHVGQFEHIMRFCR